jgi:hypothetical protein
MAKLTNVRERVHQPFWDTLVRNSGLSNPGVQTTTKLFSNQARVGDLNSLTNLDNGATLPSDQSHVTLALRVPTVFRAGTVRGVARAGDNNMLSANGDWQASGVGTDNVTTFWGTGGPGFPNAPGDYHDVYRLYVQSQEQLHWSFGTGQKESISNLPSNYFPAGGGLAGDMGGVSDTINLTNGDATNAAICRLARAVLLPPRQNILCLARISPLPGATTVLTPGNVTAAGRNYLSLQDNLNAIDGVMKYIAFYMDGLFARDVQ